MHYTLGSTIQVLLSLHHLLLQRLYSPWAATAGQVGMKFKIIKFMTDRPKKTCARRWYHSEKKYIYLDSQLIEVQELWPTQNWRKYIYIYKIYEIWMPVLRASSTGNSHSNFGNLTFILEGNHLIMRTGALVFNASLFGSHFLAVLLIFQRLYHV